MTFLVCVCVADYLWSIWWVLLTVLTLLQTCCVCMCVTRLSLAESVGVCMRILTLNSNHCDLPDSL